MIRRRIEVPLSAEESLRYARALDDNTPVDWKGQEFRVESLNYCFQSECRISAILVQFWEITGLAIDGLALTERDFDVEPSEVVPNDEDMRLLREMKIAW